MTLEFIGFEKSQTELSDYAQALLARLRIGSNKTSAERILSFNFIYKALERSEPAIVFCQSPRQQTHILQLLRICATDTSVPPAETIKRLSVIAKKQKVEVEFAALERVFQQQISIADAPALQLGHPIAHRIHEHLKRVVNPALADSLDLIVGNQTRTVIESGLRMRIDRGLWEMKDFINVQLRPPRRTDLLSKLLSDELKSSTPFDYGVAYSMYTPWQCHWLAVYEFAASFFMKFGDSLPTAELRHWLSLIDGGLFFQFFENFVVVCGHPEIYTINERGRLHNESGPAARFSDGTSIYAWNGTFVPDVVIEEKRKLTPAAIDRERNIELRRLMIDIYGFQKYLLKSKLTLVSKDRYGKLYSKDLGGSRNQDIYVVQVSNSTREPDGSRRQYLLRVPPHMKTAREAVAWTFGMREEDYEIEMET